MIPTSLDARILPVQERLQRGRLRPVRQADGMERHHPLTDDTAPAEEVAEVIAERLQVVEVLVEERQPHPFSLDRADGEDADVAAREPEDRVAGRRDVRAV